MRLSFCLGPEAVNCGQADACAFTSGPHHDDIVTKQRSKRAAKLFFPIRAVRRALFVQRTQIFTEACVPYYDETISQTGTAFAASRTAAV